MDGIESASRRVGDERVVPDVGGVRRGVIKEGQNHVEHPINHRRFQYQSPPTVGNQVVGTQEPGNPVVERSDFRNEAARGNKV